MEIKNKLRLFFGFWTAFNIASFALIIVAFVDSQPQNVHVNYANFTETYPGFAASLNTFYTSYTDKTTLSLDLLANSGVCKNAKDCFGNTQTIFCIFANSAVCQKIQAQCRLVCVTGIESIERGCKSWVRLCKVCIIYMNILRLRIDKSYDN